MHQVQKILSLDWLGLDDNGKIGMTGFFLGLLFGFHILLAWILSFPSLLSTLSLSLYFPNTDGVVAVEISTTKWCLYVALMSLFHLLEFFITARFQSNTVTNDSFLVNHSKQYTIAIMLSSFEYWIESYYLGSQKHVYFISVLGIIFVLGGQAIRSLAMFTCGEHFSHRIVRVRRRDHRLVTSGIYAFLRHPSYFGWFYWSIGTQLFLCNPICFCFYLYAAWTFFNVRILDEEETLYTFYGTEYVEYCQHTLIGIPLVSSFSPKSIKGTK